MKALYGSLLVCFAAALSSASLEAAELSPAALKNTWRTEIGGRVDSPPTVWDGLAAAGGNSSSPKR